MMGKDKEEVIEGKEAKNPKRSRLKKIVLVEMVVLFLLLIGLGGYLYIQRLWDKVNHVEIKSEDIVINDTVQSAEHLKGYMNIALFGIDTNGSFEKGARSDSIIIASINNDTKEIILTSVYRDTFLDTTKGEYRKATEVYALGGPEQSLNMLNMNLDLDIRQFVSIDWNGLIDAINLMGGIEVEISEEEYHAINGLLADTARNSSANITPVANYGKVVLDGVQATSYARIRSIDNDYNRSERQRKVLLAIFDKAKTMDILTLNNLANKILPKIYTNITMGEGLAFLKDITGYRIKETYGFPFTKKSGTYNTAWILYADDLKTNVEELHLKLYGQPHAPSANVISISEKIKAILGDTVTSSPPPTSYEEDSYEEPVYTQPMPPTQPETSTTPATAPPQTLPATQAAPVETQPTTPVAPQTPPAQPPQEQPATGGEETTP